MFTSVFIGVCSLLALILFICFIGWLLKINREQVDSLNQDYVKSLLQFVEKTSQNSQTQITSLLEKQGEFQKSLLDGISQYLNSLSDSQRISEERTEKVLEILRAPFLYQDLTQTNVSRNDEEEAKLDPSVNGTGEVFADLTQDLEDLGIAWTEKEINVPD